MRINAERPISRLLFAKAGPKRRYRTRDSSRDGPPKLRFGARTRGPDVYGILHNRLPVLYRNVRSTRGAILFSIQFFFFFGTRPKFANLSYSTPRLARLRRFAVIRFLSDDNFNNNLLLITSLNDNAHDLSKLYRLNFTYVDYITRKKFEVAVPCYWLIWSSLRVKKKKKRKIVIKRATHHIWFIYWITRQLGFVWFDSAVRVIKTFEWIIIKFYVSMYLKKKKSLIKIKKNKRKTSTLIIYTKEITLIMSRNVIYSQVGCTSKPSKRVFKIIIKSRFVNIVFR